MGGFGQHGHGALSARTLGLKFIAGVVPNAQCFLAQPYLLKLKTRQFDAAMNRRALRYAGVVQAPVDVSMKSAKIAAALGELGVCTAQKVQFLFSAHGLRRWSVVWTKAHPLRALRRQA